MEREDCRNAVISVPDSSTGTDRERGGEIESSPLCDAQREREQRREKIREENERHGEEW